MLILQLLVSFFLLFFFNFMNVIVFFMLFCWGFFFRVTCLGLLRMANCKKGILKIEGKKEKVSFPSLVSVILYVKLNPPYDF